MHTRGGEVSQVGLAAVAHGLIGHTQSRRTGADGLHVAARTGMACWSSLLRWSFVSDVSFVAADRLAVGRSCLVCACMGFGIGAGLV